MVFKSKSQARACWAQYNRDIKAGRKPKWNCHEFAKHTDYSKLPEKVKAKLESGNKIRVYIGPRGGLYIMEHGKKKYL